MSNATFENDACNWNIYLLKHETQKNVLLSLGICVLEPSTEININPGRFKYFIKREILLHLRSLGFN